MEKQNLSWAEKPHVTQITYLLTQISLLQYLNITQPLMDFSLTKPVKLVNPSQDLRDSQKGTEGSAQDYTESSWSCWPGLQVLNWFSLGWLILN